MIEIAKLGAEMADATRIASGQVLLVLEDAARIVAAYEGLAPWRIDITRRLAMAAMPAKLRWEIRLDGLTVFDVFPARERPLVILPSNAGRHGAPSITLLGRWHGRWARRFE